MEISLSKDDMQKLISLNKIRKDNLFALSVFKKYLDEYNTLADKDSISEICRDCGTEEADAAAHIICAAFEIEDRDFAKKYIFGAIRKLSAEDYINDAYLRNIRFPTQKSGNWEFKTESYDAYRLVTCDDLKVFSDLTEIPQLGFFDKPFSFPAVLENGNEWMTLTPVDTDTAKEAIKNAHGKVITFGLGLGYFAYHAALKDETSSVCIVEKSKEVINLFSEYILPQFEPKRRKKIKIINADAFEYAKNEMARENYDTAFFDTWRDPSDGYGMYLRAKKIEKDIPHTEWYYWIEEYLISILRKKAYDEIWLGANAPEIASEIKNGYKISSFSDILSYLSKEKLKERAATEEY
ncbi:MAG: hypothetical protein J5922_05325 [Clostridia bacterium]|nr:hypothetical protein [Clostridia bacterium]